MPSLTKAFNQMRRRGLIATRECYCERCGEESVLDAAQRWRDKQREVRGFVYVGEWGPFQTEEEVRVPLVFGLVTGDTVTHNDPGCVPVGEVVAECLRGQGIRYEWDEVPGSPILVNVDERLSGVPLGGHRHNEIPLDENHRVFRSPRLPDSAFDRIEGNPVRLLNLATLRRLNADPPHLRGPRPEPRVGDHVKLGFLVRDTVAPAARKEVGDMMGRLQLEAMWVEVTSVVRTSPEPVYRGELVNVPVFLDPGKVRLGSPVDFTSDHVYPVEEGAGAGAER
jgi:hypothetical protein